MYVLSMDRVVFKCRMEYKPSGHVVCQVTGVELNCLTTVVERLSLSNYVTVREGPTLYISTEIHTVGKTMGEVIKEIATVAQLCHFFN